MALVGKALDVICFVIGPVMLASSIFAFSYEGIEFNFETAFGYVYSAEARNSIAIGVALVAIGFLRKHWAQQIAPT